MSKIYDISLTLRPDIPVWPEGPRMKSHRVTKLEDGELANVTHLDMCAHTGTHVDAPYHFLKEGSTVDRLSLEVLTGEAVVIELGVTDQITAKDLQDVKIPPGTKRLLIKTCNSQEWVKGATEFNEDYIAIEADGAQYLVDHGIELIGVDYLSVAPYKAVAPTHKILLNARVVVVEGLNLSEVKPGIYTFYCLPLKIADADGAPARAILVES